MEPEMTVAEVGAWVDAHGVELHVSLINTGLFHVRMIGRSTSPGETPVVREIECYGRTLAPVVRILQEEWVRHAS